MKALVTGGTRGIGEAIVKELAACGHTVTLTGTKPRAKAIRGTTYRCCDLSDPQDLHELAQHVREGTYSILINNAGINIIGTIDRYTLHDFQRVQQVNVTAPFLLNQAAIPFMRKKKFGRILNITSIFGLVSRAGRAAYSTSKSSLMGMSRALALEVARDNILVNCLAPGFVDTDLTRASLGPAGIRQLLPQIPQHRLARPQEIAALARFLVSSENSYMTGQQVIVDGGFTCA